MARPAVFLDRDGTIIVDRHFPAEPRDVALIPGAARGLRRFQQAGYALIVISNQSGIARGLYDETAYHAIQHRMQELLADHGVTIDAALFCPHHPDFTGPCDCRKPGLRLFEEAAETLDVDLPGSVFIGDRLRDVSPSRVLGGTAIVIQSGGEAEPPEPVPDWVVVETDLGAAAQRVLGPETAG